MTYETMDWEAEAKRVAAAFGVTSECIWIDLGSKGNKKLVSLDAAECKYGIPISEDAYALIEYSRKWRYFEIFDGYPDISIYINWQGVVWDEPDVIQHSDTISKALFHLSLLTPEAEASLKVAISHHQKLEWTLEYEARLAAQGIMK